MTTPSENENASAVSAPSFPQYPAPQPHGPHFVERKTSDPLFKLARLMMKPHQKLMKTPVTKHKAKTKKTKYY